MRCCVPNCKNDSRHMSKSQGITFHVFPTESGLRKSWLRALGKVGWLPKERSAVCSEHFLSDDLYETRSGLRKVRAGAVPLFLQDASNGQTNHSEGKFCDVHTDTQTDTLVTEVVDVKKEKIFVNENNDYNQDVIGGVKDEFIRDVEVNKCTEFIVKNEDYIDMFVNENDDCNQEEFIKNEESGDVADEPAPCPSGENDLLDGDDGADRDLLLTEKEFSPDSLPLEIRRTQKVTIQSMKTINHENNQHQIYPCIGKHSEADHRSIYIEHSFTQTDRLVTVDVEVKNEDSNDDIFLNESNDCNQEEPVIDEEIGEEPGQDADDPLKLMNARQDKNTEAKIEKNSEEQKHKSQESPLTDTNTGTMVPVVTECRISDADSSRITNEIIELKNKVDVQKNKSDRITPKKCQAQVVLRTSKNTKTSHNLINDSNYNNGVSKIILNNTKDPSYSCDLCDYNTNTENKLNAHLKAHSASIRFSCHLCFYITSVKMSLIQHIRTHTGEKPYSCNVCDKKFNRKFSLNTHKRLHTGEKPYMCNICKKKFIKKHHLDEHLRIHTGEKPYSCNVCYKKFNRKFSLNIHKKMHTDEKPYMCNICNKKFIKKHHLDKHLRIHTGVKLYSCDVCLKKFIQKSCLDTHLGMHTREKPFSCNVCHKKFYHKQHLNAHLKIHTGKKPHTCNLCDKKFIYKHHLDEHLRIHTGEMSYSCDVCDKKMTKKSNFVRHMRIHTAEMPYSCVVCDKKFRQKNDLDRHIRIHTGEMPYSCEVCDEKFNQKSSLDRHNIRKH